MYKGHEESWPCVIEAGQYGATENLYLSKNHAILVNDYFICPNHINLKQDKTFEFVEYYSIQTEDFYSDVIIANGVFVETWDGNDNSTNIPTEFPRQYKNATGYRRLLKNIE